MTRRAPLELAYVPRGVEEPLLGYYSVTPLTPGGWADLLGDVGLPDTLRRLSQTVAVGDSHRTVEMRCLEMLPARRPPPDRARRAVERLGARLAAGGAGRRAVDPRRRRASPTWAGSQPRSRRPATRSSSATRRARSPPRRPPAPWPGSSTPRPGRCRRRCATRASCARPRRTPTSSTSGCSSRSCAPSPPTSAWRRRSSGCTTRSRRCACGSRRRPTRTPAGRCTPIPPIRRSSRRRRGSSPPLARATDGHVTLGRAGGRRAAPGRRGARVRGRGRRAAVRAGRGAGPRVRREPTSSSPPGALSLGGVVRYDLRASLGGREISAEEFQALAAATQPLVRVGGEWRALKGRALARAKALAAIALHGSSMPAMTALGAALAGRYEVRGMAVEVGDPTGELEQLVGRLRGPELRRAASSRPRRSRASCARTRRSAWGGSRGRASSAWARSSPTTWASGRPCR